MGYYKNLELKEHHRQYVERLLDSDLSVPEWCRRNGIKKQTMYRWLTSFAETEPELFGGVQNITDSSKRRWMETTKANMRASRALATTQPTPPAPTERTETKLAPGVIIVDTLYCEPTKDDNHSPETPSSMIPILIELNGASITIPPGCTKTDIAVVLEAVSRL